MKWTVLMLLLAAINCVFGYMARSPFVFGIWLFNVAVWGINLGHDIARGRA